jgi:hypothetical protein
MWLTITNHFTAKVDKKYTKSHQGNELNKTVQFEDTKLSIYGPNTEDTICSEAVKLPHQWLVQAKNIDQNKLNFLQKYYLTGFHNSLHPQYIYCRYRWTGVSMFINK